MRPKTASDLTRWLLEDVSPKVGQETEAIAHGGTALTLLGIKPSTKDVDFAFRTREAFDRFGKALDSMGFEKTGDLRAVPGEVFQRFENPASGVDVVDLRFPTWNHWRLTKSVLARAVVLRLGNVRLVRPDRDTVFLFETYPLRDTDLDDLRRIIDANPPDEERVVALFDEQDGIHRSELYAKGADVEPLFLLLDLRFRFAASMRLLGHRHRSRIPDVARHAQARFRQLRLRRDIPALLAMVDDRDRLMSWDRVLGRHRERLRKRLASGSEAPVSRSRRRAGRRTGAPRGDRPPRRAKGGRRSSPARSWTSSTRVARP
ncbi:MAG: hypothetical protein AABY30_04880, partial [Candidatus Thermoplasmatota archaeon]